MNNIKQFDKDAYERLENALKESSHLIQINADSGLTYDVNSENVPERFYVRDGEFNKVETVPFKLFGQEIKVPIRTVKQKLPNGSYKEFRMIESADALEFFETAEAICDLAEIVIDEQVAARVIYPIISDNVVESSLGDDFALRYEGLLYSTDPAKQKELMINNEFERMVKGMHKLFTFNTKKMFGKIAQVIKDDKGMSSNDDRMRFAMAQGIGAIATTEWNTDSNPIVVNLNNQVAVKSVPTFGTVLPAPNTGNVYTSGTGNVAPINIPQVDVSNNAAPQGNTTPPAKGIKRK